MAQQKKTRTFSVRVMHVTMTMLSLLLVLKVNDLYLNSRELNELLSVRSATAEEAKEEAAHEEEAKHDEVAKKEEEHEETKNEDAKDEEAAKKDDEHKDEAKKEEDDHKEEAKKENEEEGEHEEAKEEGGHDGGHGESSKPKEPEVAHGRGKITLKEIEELKAKEAQTPYTQSELDLLQNLTKRRQELDDRENELEIKAKVLEATEKRITDKMTEMKTLQTDLTKVVAEYNNQQDAEIKSLVKIYESMKPAQASAIFNELDMPILLSVVDKMSERKVAPVLAGMDPKRARDVTQELAEMRRKQSAMKQAAGTATSAN